MKTIKFQDFLEEKLKNKAFKKEWDKSELQYQVVRQLIKARLDKQYSQRDLAKKAQTTQSVVSRVESMSFNPSIGLLNKLSNALDKKLKITFL